MTAVYSRAQIAQVIHPREVIAAMERAFVAYSNGRSGHPTGGPAGLRESAGGLSHQVWLLEAGLHLHHQDRHRLLEEPERGLASSNGVVLVFSRETGELLTIFQDEGFLTDMRTAAAGAVAAKYLAPREISCIGISVPVYRRGSSLTICRGDVLSRVKLWARATDRARALEVPGFDIEVVPSPATSPRAHD